MNVFVDTSAFYALLDASDRHHDEAASIWKSLVETDAGLITHNYVLFETAALVQRRLGLRALAVFQDDVLPLVSVHWAEEDLHSTAMAILRASGQKNLSLVDCVSFEVMRIRGLRTAFAFDDDYKIRGFEILQKGVKS